MKTFETIVRPFQTIGVSPPVRVVTTEKNTSDVVLQLGLTGSGRIFNCTESSSLSFYHDRENKEFERKTQTKKVTNPDDENQFIDVELIKKLTVKGGSGLTYEKQILSLENT